MSDIVERFKAEAEKVSAMDAPLYYVHISCAEAREVADTIEALRAENARLLDINRWNIERDGDDIYICESNHHRSDKCEYERWYHRAYVDALRDDNAELKRIMADYRRRMSSFIFDYKTLEDECDVMRADKRRLKEELEALRAEKRRLLQLLNEALEGYEDCISYKSEYLVDKHVDKEEVARIRAAMGESDE